MFLSWCISTHTWIKQSDDDSALKHARQIRNIYVHTYISAHTSHTHVRMAAQYGMPIKLCSIYIHMCIRPYLRTHHIHSVMMAARYGMPVKLRNNKQLNDRLKTQLPSVFISGHIMIISCVLRAISEALRRCRCVWEREIEGDRQTDRQTDRQIDRQTNRQTDK